MTTIANTSPAIDLSYWARMRGCLSNEKVIATAKAGGWIVIALAPPFIPGIPYWVKAASMGASMFMACHQMIKHPDSSAMRNEAWRNRILSRNWKDLAAGATLWAVGWGLGSAAFEAKMDSLALIAYMAGPVCGEVATYSDCTDQNLVQELARQEAGQELARQEEGL